MIAAFDQARYRFAKERFTKLETRDRGEAVRHAREMGLVAEDS